MARRLNTRRGRALVVLGAAVLAVHGCATQWLAGHLFVGTSSDLVTMRMEVAYVRQMAAEAAPPGAMAPAAPPTAAAAAVVAPQAASAPEPAASRERHARPKAEVAKVAAERAPEVTPEPVPEALPEPTPAPEPMAALPPATAAPETEPVAAAQAPPAAQLDAFAAPTVLAPASQAESTPDGDGKLAAFDWPVSTRMSYRLTGNVRGEVNGQAQVEWIRVDNRYQVHLDVTVGLSIAPLMTRRMSSDGDITPEGLSPRRYEQDTKVGFGARQRVAVLFERDVVVLAGSQRRERWPGMQDTASQFIQLTYLFATRPELLQVGHALEVPLALPRSTSRWAYDVVGEETVHTPIGAIETFHLKPRRTVVKRGDLSAEIWFAPSYRYLPVRIRIEQDADTFIDLVVERRPELAAR